MTEVSIKRKLTAILCADVKSYSRMMGEDEEGTFRTLTACLEIMTTIITTHRGRVFSSPGDAILAQFDSVVDAVQCAVEIQEKIKVHNVGIPEDRKMRFRIGINLSDVIEKDEQIYGDGVNIAARIESLADPDGVFVSQTVYEHVGNKLKLEYEYQGEHQVKNIAEPVKIYRVLLGAVKSDTTTGKKQTFFRKKWMWPVLATVLLLAAFAGITRWYFSMDKGSLVKPVSLEKMAFSLPDKPSIAVLPFDNISRDPEQEYFSDGLTEEIITALSKVPEMFVIASNSTFTYKGRSIGIQHVAEELGVRYVLEGSVRKDKDKVRITVKLIDALTGHNLWAERYDRNIGDIFAVQDEITLAILNSLEVRLTDGEQAYLQKRGTNNLQVYLQLLQANHYLQNTNLENNLKARRMFEDIIAKEPHYATAYTLLARTHIFELYLGTTKSPKESLRKIAELAEKSLSIDPSQGGPYATLGNVTILRKDWKRGRELLFHAVELEPSRADSYRSLGLGLCFAGSPEEAIPILKKAIRLNPIAPPQYLNSMAIAYRMVGKYDKAIEYLEKGRQRYPNHIFLHVNLSVCYVLAGRVQEAHKEAKEVLRLNPGFSHDKFAKTVPLKNQEERKRFVGALRKAFAAAGDQE